MVKLCGNGIFKKEFSTLLPEDFHQLILMIIKSQERGGDIQHFPSQQQQQQQHF
jgi:hypothetical protein